jgi:hypothetical protein
MFAYLPGVACCGVVRVVPEMAGVPGDAAGLRAANTRLRELLAERDAEIAVPRGQVAELAALRARAAELQAEAAGLQSQVADVAARVARNSKNSSQPPSADGLAKPESKSLRKKSGRGQAGRRGSPARRCSSPIPLTGGCGTCRLAARGAGSP